MADLASLMGMSPDDLNAIMQQLQPSDEDKAHARQQAAFAMAAGLLGNAYKPTIQGLGAGMQSGLLGYNADLKEQTDLRGRNITQAMAIRNAAQDADIQTGIKNWLAGNAPGGAMGAGALPQGAAGPPVPGAAAGPGAGGGPGAYGVPPIALQMAMSPRYAKMGEMIATAAKDENVREGGSIVRKDANGNPYLALTAPKLGEGLRMNAAGQVEPIPGYIPSRTAAETAAADVKNARQIVDGIDSQGRPVKGYAPQVFGQPQGAAPQVAQADPLTTAIPQNAQEAAALGSMLSARGLNSQYFQDNGQFRLGPQHGTPIQPTGGTMTGPNPVTMKAAEAQAAQQGEALGKQPQAIDDAAQAAQTTLARTAEVRGLMKAYTPGKLAPIRGEIGAVAQSAGLPMGLVQTIAGGSPGAIEATTKANIDSAFDEASQALRSAGGGQRISQMEILLKAKTSPGASLTPQANEVLLGFREGVANRAIDMQAAKEDWLAQHNRDMTGFAADFNKAHPLTSYIPSAEQLNDALFPGKATSTGGGKHYVFDGKKLVPQ